MCAFLRIHEFKRTSWPSHHNIPQSIPHVSWMMVVIQHELLLQTKHHKTTSTTTTPSPTPVPSHPHPLLLHPPPLDRFDSQGPRQVDHHGPPGIDQGDVVLRGHRQQAPADRTPIRAAEDTHCGESESEDESRDEDQDRSPELELESSPRKKWTFTR